MNQTFVIQLNNVEKTFGTQKILRGVNLSIPEGKTTVIVGGSGQGKSVIIKHILGLVQPDSGSILINGKDINNVKKKELKEIRSQFGVLFQNAAL
ncbi:MAG: ATP-binding cassette domain-containing protein, partial [Nitrospirota bacterium]